MTITLNREEANPTGVAGERGSWPLRISAFFDEGLNDPAPVFVYQRAGQGSSLNGDSFCFVADVLNMNELPVDAPAEDAPYYRTSVVDVVCRSAQHALEFWEGVTGAIRILVDETEASSSLQPATTLTIAP